MLKNSKTAYGTIAKIFHWLVFFLVFFLLLLSYFIDDISDKSLRGTVINIHKLTGLSILALIILRAVWTIVNVKPALPASIPAYQQSAARIGHVILYILLIAMPMSGWIMSVTAGYSPHFFDWVLSLPLEKNKILSGFFFDIHQILAIVIIVFVSLHIFAALYHQFIKKDGLLLRMLPKKK